MTVSRQRSAGLSIRHGILAAIVGVALLLLVGTHSCEVSDKVLLRIKGHGLTAELARSPQEHRRGLQHREYLGPDAGMLFVFEGEVRRTSFWMKDTLIPLSIAFIDGDGLITQIEEMMPMTETLHVSSHPVRFALEVNQGWFRAHGITVGDTVDLSRVPRK